MRINNACSHYYKQRASVGLSLTATFCTTAASCPSQLPALHWRSMRQLHTLAGTVTSQTATARLILLRPRPLPLRRSAPSAAAAHTLLRVVCLASTIGSDRSRIPRAGRAVNFRTLSTCKLAADVMLVRGGAGTRRCRWWWCYFYCAMFDAPFARAGNEPRLFGHKLLGGKP